jgi:hypothetical protein
MEEDLKLLDNSPVKVGELVLISYGEFSEKPSSDYKLNMRQD